MAALITLAEAKEELRITHSYEDAVIERKIAEASTAILMWLKTGADETWTETTAPEDVKGAVRMYVEFSMAHRGDDETDSAALWKRITALLERRRDPALA